MQHIDAFKQSLEERMAEIGVRSGWKHDGYKRSFLIQEVCSSERMAKRSHGGIGMGEEVLKPPWRQRTLR